MATATTAATLTGIAFWLCQILSASSVVRETQNSASTITLQQTMSRFAVIFLLFALFGENLALNLETEAGSHHKKKVAKAISHDVKPKEKAALLEEKKAAKAKAKEEPAEEEEAVAPEDVQGEEGQGEVALSAEAPAAAPPAAPAPAAQEPPAAPAVFTKIAPFGKEDTAKELQEHASRTQDTLVDAVENAEVAEIKRSVFRALTRLRAASIKEFDTIARLETQAIDGYNDAHHYRSENPLAHLHEEEAPVETDKLKSFH
eukprot:TRINITY_DN377_c0_g1_i2.p1 TRINITY_DN377_c0_g1~~TRINITY_DN377_c0_g1_i2.p1  ORF type:complete len:260 (+),score=93.64 TRINITY_DN377_c0_g1_i2:64-843(+)